MNDHYHTQGAACSFWCLCVRLFQTQELAMHQHQHQCLDLTELAMTCRTGPDLQVSSRLYQIMESVLVRKVHS